MSKVNIPTGVLPMFRLFIIIRLCVAIILVLNLIGKPWVSSFEWSAALSLIECLLLIGYLSWPWLEKKMGKVHLPVGIILATIGPWVENVFFVFAVPTLRAFFPHQFNAYMPEIGRIITLATQFQLIFALFIPLMLLSWRYSLRWMVIYSLGLLGLDIVQFFLQVFFMREPISPMMGGAVIRTFSFLLIGFVINRLAAEQKQQNERLLAANQQLSNYAGTLEQLATSRERNRLAREIHDTLAHTLSGLAVNLEAIGALWKSDPEKAQQILNESLSVTRNGLVETRRAIQAMRAGPLEDLGLILALQQLARSTAERENLEFETHLPERLEALDPAAEQCIYRIAEEGLRNLSQHSGATRFSMTLNQDPNQLEFSIQDNGRGFDANNDTEAGHYGLQGMRERAETVCGSFNIQSQPGSGTLVKFELKGSVS
jgi:signal transduction histidine kinase